MKVDVEQPEERNRPDATTSDSRIEARWLRITEIVGAAWELPASSRDAYVAEHCRGDDSMREEVRKLLEQLANSSALLQTGLPSIGAFAARNCAGNAARSVQGPGQNRRRRDGHRLSRR